MITTFTEVFMMDESLKQRIRDEFRIRNCSQGTAKQYIYHIGKFLDWTGKPLEELTLYDARDYIIMKRESGLKPESCNGVTSALIFLFRYMLHIKWDLDIIPRMKRNWKLPEVLSHEDIEKLIDTAHCIRNKAIIALMYSSGLRVGEICKLAPFDISMSTMQVHVRNSKNHGDHWTVLSERALELLKQYWYSCPEPRDTLFVSQRKPHVPLCPGGVESMLKKISAEAGIKAHPHMLRHSFATHLIEDRVPREYVQSMLGHRSPNSTAVYINITNKSIMGIVSPLDKDTKKSIKKSSGKARSSKKKSGGKKDE
jgi:site-specific recombinase XerD